MKKIKLWIRKNLKVVAGVGGIVMLAGCSTMPATTTTPVTATTKSATVTSATSTMSTVLTSTQKTEFLGWAESCQGYALAVYGASAALANGTLKPAAIPYLEAAKATVTPLCHSFPANPTAAKLQILNATINLTSQLANLHTTPSTPTK